MGSDHSLVNLAQITDMAPEFGLGDVHEARFAGRPLGLTQLGLAYYRIHPGRRQPFAHRHANQEEVYVLLAGGAVAHLDGETVTLTPMDALRVGPAVNRHLEAGPAGAELLAFGAPAASAGRNDAEMIPLEDPQA